MARRNTIADFWRQVDQSGRHWLWTGTTVPNKSGEPYGRFYWDGGAVLVHRFSWELHNRARVPKGKLVCHHCDIPLCVHPDDLYVGTDQTNARDREDRKRRDTRPGEAHHNARLPETDILVIRGLAGSMTHAAIGERFGISRQHVGDILSGRKWQVAGGAISHSHAVGRPLQLSSEQLDAMVAERAAGVTQRVLAERYGLTQSGVSKYLRRHR